MSALTDILRSRMLPDRTAYLEADRFEQAQADVAAEALEAVEAHNVTIREQAKRDQMEAVTNEIEAAQNCLRPYESESDYGAYTALRDLHTKLYAAWAKDHREENR